MNSKFNILSVIFLSIISLCGCTANSNTSDTSSTYNVSDNFEELSNVEYIDEDTLKESLWEDTFHKRTTNNNQEIIIALLDVGISKYYKNSNYLYQNYDEIEGNLIDDDNNGFIDDVNGWNFIDDNGDIINYNLKSIHASAILGILFGENEYYNYYGLLNNSSVKFVPIKVLNDNNASGNINNIIKAIDYAELINADIIAMSFSTYIDSQELKNIMFASDMLFVVAAGNDGMELDTEYKVFPACYNNDNIIAVAAVTDNNDIDSCSNYGKNYIDIAATGNNIVSYLGDNKFTYVSGTSFSVPFVVAKAAIIACSSETRLTAHEIKNVIINNVSYYEHLADKIISGGIVDINKMEDLTLDKTSQTH